MVSKNIRSKKKNIGKREYSRTCISYTLVDSVENRKTFIPAWKSTTSFWRSQHPLDIYPYFQVCSISNYNNIYINNDTENTRNKESWDSSPSEFLPRDDRCRSYFLSSFLSDWLHRHIVIARHLKLVNHTPTFLLPEVAIEGEGAPRNTQQRFIGRS